MINGIEGFDPASDDETVITIGYLGDPAKNRGLEQAIKMIKANNPGVRVIPVQLDATQPRPCSSTAPCCDRRDEYNGFASGPIIFNCPKRCACHD